VHINPIFTDSRGNPITHKRRKPLRQWQRFTISILLVAFGPLVLMAAITQIDAAHQLKGLVPIANGGTNTTSTLTGVVRGGSAYTAAELSGDATTSGSNAVTVAKVNGTSVGTNAAADQVVVTTASATAAWTGMPNCTAGAIQYATSTHTFTCGTVLTGTFSDAEVPTGTINGVNAAFVFAHTPTPAGSLAFYKNGQQMIAGGVDYTLATATATFVAGSIPQTGDAVIGFYRY